MSEKESQIKEWLRILYLMEDFLEEYDYKGIYTRLEKTEGQFVDLDKYLEAYKAGGARARTNWSYTDMDVSNMKAVCFDYIRARYEGKEFRDIASTGKNGSIFYHKDLWDEFFSQHQANTPMDEETVDELRRHYPGEDLSLLLKKRDKDWTDAAIGLLTGNLRRFSRKLDDKRASNKPAELLERALNALQSVDVDQNSFTDDPHVAEMVNMINSITYDMKKILKRR